MFCNLKSFQKKLALILFWSLVPLALPAQEYPQKIFTVDDGLSQSIVNMVLKDSYGFIWVATNEGLSRFNGKTFKNFNQKNGYPLHLVSGVVEKEPGVLWVADYGRGLFELKNNTLKKISFDSTLTHYYINFIKKATDNSILMGVELSGLYRFYQDSIVSYQIQNSGEHNVVLAAALENNNLWIGTYASGAKLLKQGKVIRTLTVEDGLPANEVRSILVQKDGKVWIGTAKGLFVLNGPSISDDFNERYPDSKIMNLYAPDSENVYVNINNKQGGVVHFFRNKIVDEIDVNVSVYTKSTFIDAAGVMYIGTYDGLAVLPDRTVRNYGKNSGLKDTYVRVITVDPYGRLWVGTKNNGIFYWDTDHFISFPLKKYGTRFNTPSALSFYNNQFWIGTRRGLLVLEGKRAVQNAATASLDSLEIRKLSPHDSALFVVTKTHLFQFENDSLKEITYNLKGKVRSFWGMEYDRNGTLWLASNGWGLWTLSDTTWHPFNPYTPPQYIYGVRNDDSGNLIFPSSQGAYLWDGQKLRNIYSEKGNVWDAISIYRDDYWFGTSHGLVHKTPFYTGVHSRANGYASSEFNIGSFYHAKNQKLYFGGVTGLVEFDASIGEKWENQSLFIEKIRTPDSAIYFPSNRASTLRIKSKNIWINYESPSFKNRLELRFRYYLEGFDADTSDFIDEREVHYTNLPSGKYTFYVFASLGKNRSYFKSTKLSFEVSPSWWETWWAILLYVIMGSIVTYLLIHWREQMLRQRNMLLEQRIDERMTELRASNKRLIAEIKERKKAEKALSEEKEQLSVTLAAIIDGVIRFDTRSKIILMNAVAERLTGCSFEEALGRNFEDIFTLEDDNESKITFDFDQHSLSGKDEHIYSQNAYLIHGQSGERFPVFFSIAPIFGLEKQIMGYVCVFRDISHEKEAEAEAIKIQKMESIGLLAGGIAHDFNNILSGILGNVQLAGLVNRKGKPIDKYLIGIEDATQTAATLTQQLLTFSKGGEPVKKTIRIADILVDAVQFALRGSNVKSAFFIDNKLWPVQVDPGQIGQVINNLTINADQAMPSGGTLTIEANNIENTGHEIEPLLARERFVEIKFSDQGIGISKENLSKIFDPYFTTKQKGSGLGLASSYSIIEKHKGLITVQSTLGEGTTFTIYLPAFDGACEEKSISEEVAQSGSGKILIMDDERYIRNLMRDMLEILGYEVETAKDGREAISMYRKAMQEERPFAAVIMDLTIPGGMGGKDTIRELMILDPNVKSIVSSGYSADSIMANYGDFGFIGILQKPFKMEEIGAMLKEVLKK